MLELLLCSLVTVFPDYLFRRYGQGKRIGQEITLYSVWFELRWGITACAMLTITLITVIFYYHPSTTAITSFFRTVTILPEAGGRVAEVYVGNNDDVTAGAPLFRLDDSSQRAAAETARRRIAEIDAELAVARTELAQADGAIAQAEGALRQAQDELDSRREINARNPNVVSAREIERLQTAADTRQGAVDAARAQKAAVEERVSVLLPAQRASAEAALAEAQVAIDKALVAAGTAGRVEQFALQVGDFVSPVLRPAGLLVPEGSGQGRFQAGFGQISAQVIEPGMVAEIACTSAPYRIIPMVVTDVQDVIAAGQFRPTDALVDPGAVADGSVTVFLEPLWAGGADGVPPGSRCIGNVYTSNHDRLHGSEALGAGHRLFLHAVDTVGVVHALLLRIQTLLLPVRTLVLQGH